MLAGEIRRQISVDPEFLALNKDPLMKEIIDTFNASGTKGMLMKYSGQNAHAMVLIRKWGDIIDRIRTKVEASGLAKDTLRSTTQPHTRSKTSKYSDEERDRYIDR